MMCGPPCSSWVFMNVANHCRDKACPWGDTDEEFVRVQSTLASNLVVLLLVATCRRVWTVVEQPSTSLMVYFEVMRQWSMWAKVSYCSTWMRIFGAVLPKAAVLWGTLPTLQKLRRTWTRAVEKKLLRLSLAAARKSKYLVKVKAQCAHARRGRRSLSTTSIYTKTTENWVSGQRLQGTAAYPPGFALALIDAWKLARLWPGKMVLLSGGNYDYEKVADEIGLSWVV